MKRPKIGPHDFLALLHFSGFLKSCAEAGDSKENVVVAKELDESGEDASFECLTKYMLSCLVADQMLGSLKKKSPSALMPKLKIYIQDI